MTPSRFADDMSNTPFFLKLLMESIREGGSRGAIVAIDDQLDVDDDAIFGRKGGYDAVGRRRLLRPDDVSTNKYYKQCQRCQRNVHSSRWHCQISTLAFLKSGKPSETEWTVWSAKY
uniref:Fructose-bisphosphatase n=1 Tax=Panagrellus redivivus TaxID=6233 RepID=A0A7E4V0Z2_PANRE